MYNSEDRYRQSLARPGPLGLLIDSTQKNVVSNHFINISKSSDGRRSRSDGSSLVSSSSQNNKNWNESADSKSFVFDEKFQFSVDDTRNQKDQSPDRFVSYPLVKLMQLPFVFYI